ncbi:uncharacterized protein isoform X3 [Leptinotarsa decemlineata]|uniref:uncharacterized protein isoform X3 n=1 Tax=Leptinotarsa decemlineata TaxID=7539 RepID=UPI003D304A6F
MRFFDVVLIFILGNECVMTSSNECRNSKHCRCINKFEEYEFQCTSNNDNVVVHAVSDKYIKIDCFSTKFKVNILPNYTAGNIELFELRFCPLTLIGFFSVLEKFGIENLENVRLKALWKNSSNETVSLTKDFLRSLSSMRNLYISVSDNVTDVEAFGNFPKLTNQYLPNNSIQEVGGMFIIPKHLKVLHLSNNALTHIPNGTFQNLVELQQLRLWKNNLSGITKYDFAGLNHLKSLELNSNHIQFIDKDAFSNLSELINISLRGNQLGHINSNIFRHNQKLNNILIEFNSNVTLDDYVFANLKKLCMVNLAQSGLTTIPEHVFEGSENIETLLLQNNFLREFSKGVFSSLKNLKQLNLSSNNILSIPDTLLSPLVNLEVLDLRGNIISEINYKIFKSPKNLKKLFLNNNQIKTIMPNAFQNNKGLISIDLSNNLFDMKYECMLEYNPFMNCDQLEELLLSGNRIDEFPLIIMHMILRRKLNLKQDNSSSFHILKLDGNQLTHLNTEVLKMMNPSSMLTLYNNPWSCDCSALELQNFIRAKFGNESRNIVCQEDNEPLIEKVQLCEPSAILTMKVGIPILFIIILIASGYFLYFFYEEEIKIYLYTNSLPSLLINREEPDEEKVWDVFISYSYQDEHFILQTLLPELENGPNPLKTCIHVRDWIPGTTITENISNSVNNSRRTLVVLSNNFLESVWGKMEFRAAHTNAIEEGRAKVIIIKFGDLDENKIDKELKMYLRTNTYVEWGKPWFWRKLRYALLHPHSRNTRNDKFEHSNGIPSVVIVLIILIIIMFIIF